HCPGHDAAAKAEHALGELIRLDRAGSARGLARRTLGLCGFNSTAAILTRAATALGMTVHAYAPDVTDGLASEMAVRRSRSMEELLSHCDVVSLHPGDSWAPEFGSETLALLADEAIVLAAEGVRGLDLAELTSFLKKGNVRVSIDQQPSELNQEEQELLEKLSRSKSVTVSREAGATLHATQRAAAEVVRIVHGFLHEGAVANCVNTIAQSDAACTLVVKHRHETAVLAEVIDVLRDEDVGLREIRNTLFQDASAAHTHLRLVARPGQTVLDRLRRKESIFDVSVDM
ncbi:MAG: NAD(P)-dependent oxidoreductase, partial [Myxococcota bacterium]|nr:NAD(P)-dependent oxidoreductase [Myxococcota bacterium]